MHQRELEGGIWGRFGEVNVDRSWCRIFKEAGACLTELADWVRFEFSHSRLVGVGAVPWITR